MYRKRFLWVQYSHILVLVPMNLVKHTTLHPTSLSLKLALVTATLSKQLLTED